MKRGITAIDGIELGHYTDQEAATGCTAVLCRSGAVAGVDVRGSAPGSRETDLLRGYNRVERIHAIMLSGGSAYGLDAASGAMQYLEECGVGVDVGVAVVPIVPSAVIFDLAIGRADVRPDRRAGYEACKNASKTAALFGSVGAGTGATVSKGHGMDYCVKSGIGSSLIELQDGIYVAALAVVNALGDVYDHKTGKILAASCVDGKIVPLMEKMQITAPFYGNTTIGVIATNACLTREEANKLAAMAHDGLAMSIRPVHTTYDGDTFFAMATMEKQCESFLHLQAAAAEAAALAVEDAVRKN